MTDHGHTKEIFGQEEIKDLTEIAYPSDLFELVNILDPIDMSEKFERQDALE